MAFPSVIGTPLVGNISAQSFTPTLPAHEAGDKIEIYIAVIGSDINPLNPSNGWNESFDHNLSNGQWISSAHYWIDAPTNSVSAPTVQIAASTTIYWFSRVLRGVKSGAPAINQVTPFIYNSSSGNDDINYPAVAFDGDAIVSRIGSFRYVASLAIITPPSGTKTIDIASNDLHTVYDLQSSSGVPADLLVGGDNNQRSVGMTIAWLGSGGESTLTVNEASVSPSGSVTWTASLSGITGAYLTDSALNQYTLTNVTDGGGELPHLSHALAACLFENGVTITVTDGVDTATDTINFVAGAGRTVKTVSGLSGSLASKDWGFHLSGLANGDQIEYATADESFVVHNADGTSAVSGAGTSSFYGIDATDGVASLVNLTYGEAGGSGSKVVQSINISNLRIGL